MAKNIKDITEDGMTWLRKITMQEFDNNDGTRHYKIGVNVDTLKDEVPDLVTKMVFMNGQTVNIIKEPDIYWYMLDAIKTLDARVIVLENEIATLRSPK